MRLLFLLILLAFLPVVASSHTLILKGNSIKFDGRRGEILYRDSGDLDGDGKPETVLLAWTYDMHFGGVIVTRRTGNKYKVIAAEGSGISEARADITDINGDGKNEVVCRYMSGDGHPQCDISVLRGGRLVSIAHFGDTKFRDLTGDGIPEVLALECISFGFTGDHWLTIWKWNGRGYSDLSARFPRQYDAVIHDLHTTIYELRHTKRYGSIHKPEEDADIFADFYFYLGKAYEYRRLPEKARMPYAIAYRLNPEDEEIAAAFRRVWRID